MIDIASYQNTWFAVARVFRLGRFFRPGFAAMVGLIWLSASTVSATTTYTSGMERSQWYLASSIFECALTHPIPRFGRAVFYHEAGEDLQFYLDADRNPMRAGEAALVIEAPSWRPGSGVRDLGYVPVKDAKRPVTLNLSLSSQLMDSLLKGMQPTFTRRAKYNDESVRVEVNSVQFANWYDQYNECVAGLLPNNFRQVEKTAVYFDVNESVLSEKGKAALKRAVDYALADPSVTAVYVDGHADGSGRRISNRRLSKDRAEAVTAYLEQLGLPNEKINTRYHGERYPVAKNDNKPNKARNRRTTVRLDRGDQPGNIDDFEQENDRLENTTAAARPATAKPAIADDFQDF
ncbi:flagellar protein MotY [Allohahella marinimesophila]|uniref:Flagellar protein MotY n=1 Tax=Allohahella marinimesophila TaxID=1054972 RepID=A0ABP7P471_9GAMM